MIILHLIPEMDMRNKTSILLLWILLIYISCAPGLDIPEPDKLKVKIMDGEVIVHWKSPVDAPSNSVYTVQMGRYIGNWSTVEHCTRIKETYCDLSSLISDYRASYKVRVQLVAGDDKSQWKSPRKFSLTDSELLPPTFNLLATSSTLTVRIQEKPILREIFSFGVSYTIFLEERGQDNKTTTEYLNYDMQDQITRTISSLHWGKEYCISIKVQGNGGLFRSGMSPKQCLVLPEQEWYIMAVSSLSLLSVLVVVVIIIASLLCYLRRPEKTPAALKSTVSGWHPLSVGEGTMEVVTDKGWFLSSYRTKVKSNVKDPVPHVTLTEDNEDEDRRTSLDSGINIESNSAKTNRGSPPMRQEDSGCGSLGGSEGPTSGQTDYPMGDERTDTDTVRKREDSGVGLGCQLDSFSLILDGQDTGLVKESVAGGNYRSQSPSAVHINVYDEEEEFKQILPDTVLAEVVTGYRAGPQSCICSGSGKCNWCHKQGRYESDVIKQYKAMCIENELLASKHDFVDSYKAGLTFSSYRKTQMDTVMVDDLENTFIQLEENFPLLTGLSLLHLGDGGQDFNMNNVSLSLCDVELKTD